jgi:prepilin-type N-terminal cleavage/methylation domain-containing protein
MMNNKGTGRRGMTLPELLIGVSISGLVVASMSSFLMAVSQGWQEAERRAAAERTSRRSGLTFQDALGNALGVVSVHNGGSSGPSHMLYWKYDGLTGVPDGKVQAGELGLIEFTPATKTVWVYEPPAYEVMTTGQRAMATQSTWADLRVPEAAQTFKDLGLATPQPLVGTGSADSTGTIVNAARFASFIPAGGRPVAAYEMQLEQGGTLDTSAGSVRIRSPQVPDNLYTP